MYLRNKTVHKHLLNFVHNVFKSVHSYVSPGRKSTSVSRTCNEHYELIMAFTLTLLVSSSKTVSYCAES